MPRTSLFFILVLCASASVFARANTREEILPLINSLLSGVTAKRQGILWADES